MQWPSKYCTGALDSIPGLDIVSILVGFIKGPFRANPEKRSGVDKLRALSRTELCEEITFASIGSPV